MRLFRTILAFHDLLTQVRYDSASKPWYAKFRTSAIWQNCILHMVPRWVRTQFTQRADVIPVRLLVPFVQNVQCDLRYSSRFAGGC